MTRKTMPTNFNFSLPLVLLLLLIIHYQMAASSSKTDIDTDKSTLIAFKSHLHLDPSHVLSGNWSESDSVCDWVGVSCSSRQYQRVTSLDISSMGLTGYIYDSPQLINLTSLLSLNLSTNYFQGTLPPWIGHLPKLQTLDLSYNRLGGPIPIEIGKLTMLQILSLGDNSFSGSLPEELGNLTNLENLSMPRNNLSGLIPSQIFNISTLRSMRFRRNNLSGVLPDDMCSNLNRIESISLSENRFFGPVPTRLHECSALQFLDFSLNNLTGNIPSNIGNSTQLRTFALVDNRLTGDIPTSIGDLSRLEGLFLSGNRLSGSIPPSLLNVSTLQILALSNNQLTGDLAPDFGYKLPRLERLELFDNFLTSDEESSFITSLTNCRSLRLLGLSGITFDSPIPASIGNLSASVENIRAKNCNFRGVIPLEIGNLSRLIKLDLSGNRFDSGSFPLGLLRLSSLQGLDVSGNNITGLIPDAVCGLRSLDTLWMSDNRINGSIPDCLDNISTLSVLRIDSNELSSSVPASLWRIRDLAELNLSSNSLDGSLAREMVYSKVRQVDLSWNRLSGVIPNDIGRLQTLILLRLDHNKLEGSIPESMANTTSLKNLDLSYNDLSGSIPKSLQKLQDLNSFNVSYNRLDGEIPSDGPFRNFAFDSFMFNEGLCSNSPRFNVSRCREVSKPNKKLRVLLISLGTLVGVLFAVVLFFVGMRYRAKGKAATRGGSILHSWSRKPQPILSYHELFEATDGYNESNLLGSGGFGSVYKATLKNGKALAVKVFDLRLQGAFRSFEVECEVLRNLRHRNICRIVDCCSTQSFKALVLEYKPNGSLEKWLYSHDCFLDASQRVDVMIDVACALEYLHEGYCVPVIHCDLKPSNILLDKNMTAQLCDFGVSKLLGDGESVVQTMTLATLGYVAPEYGTGGFVSVKCDVYSYGIVLLEVFTRRRPNDEIMTLNGNLSLRSLVKDSTSANEIIDPNLLRSDQGGEYLGCLSSILELGLRCSVQSPYERMNIKDVIVALQRIKLQLQTII